MLSIEPLKERGIHEVFDSDRENSYVVKEGEKVLGYVNFHENGEKSIWIEFILAKHPGHRDGGKMVKALFDLGYDRIEGSAIYGPHFFWTALGAIFDEEPDEDIYEGFCFILTRSNFRE